MLLVRGSGKNRSRHERPWIQLAVYRTRRVRVSVLHSPVRVHSPVQGVEVYRWPERGPSRSRRDNYRRQRPRFPVSTLFAASLVLSADPGPSYFTLTIAFISFFSGPRFQRFSQVPGSSGPVPLLVVPISRFPPRSTYSHSIPSTFHHRFFIHSFTRFFFGPNSSRTR